ncbi:MAG: thiamine pyrophosphate-requiring protein [Dehalococcoidales bacterium]|nr:MAG: thiamine pyrophosphate-requiring protein [Dehalococcoidales bacterium]
MEQYTGAEAFLEICNANGIENIFFNPGGEFASINAAVLKYYALGKPAPKLSVCLHESVALTAAYGHYMVSGKPQVVLVHSELGTQQVAGALHNAQWGRIPVVLMAGIAAAPSRTNWKGEPYYQGLMTRNSVKWDYEIKPDEDIHEILQKAINISLSEPRGPVYLSYTRDILMKRIDRREFDSYKGTVEPLPPANPDDLSKISDYLLAAENPLIVAGYVERHHASVGKLIELAEILCVPVVPGLTRMNFPTTHPLCAGMEEMGGGIRGNEPFAEADVVLAIDYDTPYVPANIFPKEDATILHIDIDPMTQGRPLWGRGADVFVKADSREAIPSLTEIIKDKMTPELKTRLQARYEMVEEKYRKQREENRITAKSKSSEKPISPDWLGYCLNEIIDEDTVLVNHLISQSSSVAAQVDRVKPGTLCSCAGGSIMWALGAALGVKTAVPDKTVVSVMTDGGFVWGCPIASLWTSNAYKVPFLSVVFNNQSYGAIRTIVERLSETPMSEEMGYISGLDISPPPDYALIAESCGGYGKIVTEPEDVLPVLKEALKRVKSGKLAVVDIRLELGLAGVL